MALWTDLVDPADLTGYARLAMADYEMRRGSLARWLPNREVPDVAVRFVKGNNGLVETARFRAFDAEIEIGERKPTQRVTIDLPALGIILPVSEYEQLRMRGGESNELAALNTVENVTMQAVHATADTMEYQRGLVLATGKATINQTNFQSDDDFGRDAAHTIVAGEAWTAGATDRLEQLTEWADLYRDTNGEDPGTLVMSTRTFRLLAAGDQFQTSFINGGSRQATRAEVNAVIETAGLPPVELYDRRINVGGSTVRALPDDRVYMLPAPVDPNDWEGTQLGASFWGRTLTSTEPDWGIGLAEQPGVVAGVYRNEKPPMGIEVIADAIGLPVLGNANLSLVAKVA